MSNTQIVEYKQLEQSLGQKIFSQQELKSLNREGLDRYTENFARSLVEKITKLQKNIDEAKDLTRRAENSDTKSDWNNILTFGLSGKSSTDKAHDRIVILAQAQEHQKQSTTRDEYPYPRKYKIYLPFFAFANRMVECLGAYLAQGFEGKDGQIKKLTEKQKE